MKRKIVVLTDFSASAQKAADLAIDLAGSIQAEVILFHVYQNAPYIPLTDDLDWLCLDEYRNDEPESITLLQCEAARLKQRHEERFGKQRCPAINYQANAGVLPQLATKFTKDLSIAIIVMGKTRKPYYDLFFGSDTKDLIHHATKPVLIVPDGPEPCQLRTIVFASDLGPQDLVALGAMDRLFAALELNVAVCHVHKPVRLAYPGEDRQTIRFGQEIAKLKDLKVTFHQVFGDSVTAELDLFARSIHADATAFSIKRHSQLAEFLHRGEFLEDQMVTTSHLPILVFPPKIEV